MSEFTIRGVCSFIHRIIVNICQHILFTGVLIDFSLGHELIIRPCTCITNKSKDDDTFFPFRLLRGTPAFVSGTHANNIMEQRLEYHFQFLVLCMGHALKTLDPTFTPEKPQFSNSHQVFTTDVQL